MKKKLSIVSVAVLSIIHILVFYRVSGRGVADDIAGLIGSFIPIILGAWLVSKLANKKADDDTKLMTFAIVFCSWIILVSIYKLKLLGV